MTEEPTTSVYPDTPAHPPFDAELSVALDARPPLMAAPVSAANLQEKRQLLRDGALRRGAEPVDLTAGGLVRVEERVVPGPEGAPDLTVLVLSPARIDTPVAGIYLVHGGGMVMGDRSTGVEGWLPHVVDGGAVLVSVEYRLAPEHPDPAPVEDVYAGLVWMAGAAADLGVDPERLLIAGVSAGGGLAAGTALLARDRGYPALSHQVLVCPMLDDRLHTPSSRMLDGVGAWDRTSNLFGWTALLGERRGGPDVSDYAAPARAENLHGLPRTYLDTGSSETFRDEVLDYATRLSGAGVGVDLHMWGGAFHGFDGLAPEAALSRASRATRDEFVRRAIAG